MTSENTFTVRRVLQRLERDELSFEQATGALQAGISNRDVASEGPPCGVRTKMGKIYSS